MLQLSCERKRVRNIVWTVGLGLGLALLTGALYPQLISVHAQDQAAPPISPDSFWASGSSLPQPLIRSIGVFFPANAKFYSVGGRTSDALGSDVPSVFEFTGPNAPGSWVQKGVVLPDNQVNNMACGVLTVSGAARIYCVGGSASATVSATARVFSYDPIGDTVTTLPAGDNWPGDVSGTVLPGGFAVVGNKLYIIGGFNINVAATNQIWEFDPTKAVGAKWTAKVNAPVNLIFAPATAINGIIYVSGASDFAGGFVFDTTNSFSFNPALNSVNAIAPIPRATGETRAVTIGGKMYVLGGGRVFPNPSNEVDVYDPGSNSWTTAQSFVNPRRNFAADTNGRYIYIAGGYDTTGFPFNSMEIYDSASTADLGITKVTSNATPVVGGAAFSYTLTVTNFGPDQATNVVVTDPLPQGILLANNNISIVPNASAFSCATPANGTNGTISCTASNMQAGATETFTIVAQVAANQASGVRTNTATVTSGTTEPIPNPHPNTASVAQNLQVNAPLSITTAGPATVCASDTFTYHITVNNGGSSTALNATISDPLPANTSFLNLSGTGGFTNGCAHNGGTPGTVTCAAVNIPTGQSTLDITVQLAPGAPSGALSNTATITNAGTGTIAVGTSTTTATVNHCSDLEITKQAAQDSVLAGQDINYTITVRNVGPSNIGAGEFVVTDAPFPPAGTTLKTGTNINAPGFSCNLGITFPCTSTTALSAGATAVIKYTVTVNANFNGGVPGGSVVNTATVAIVGGSNAVDSISANNSSTTNTPVVPSADLSLQKQSFTLAGSAFDAQVTAGGAISAAPPSLPVPIVTGQGEIFYGLTYRNNGSGDAINVHIRDNLPASTQFVAGSIVVTPAAGPALTCTVSPLPTQIDCTPVGGGTLPAGANGTVSFRTRVLANVADGTAVKNTATINSEGIGATPATPDPNGGNNLSNETQNRVRTEANLSISKVGPASVNAGSNITYTITVTNNGVSDAQNVLVKDMLPPNVSFVSASSTNNQFACAPDNGNAGVVNCTAATLIANDPNIIPPRSGSNTATIALVGKVDINVPNGTVLGNNATVSATTSDPVLANNTVGPINTTVIGNTLPTLSINNVTVTEGTGGTTNANFTVTLSASSTLPVTVDYVTSDGTASTLADYTAQAGTLTFAPGVTTRSIAVPIIGDSLPEPSETFLVTLLNATNATIATAQGTGTINDDDATGGFQFSAGTATVSEAGPTVTLTINRTGDTSGVSSVGFETSDGTALQRTDYTFNSGRVQFGPGDTSKTITVSIVNDALVEGGENFRVSLLNPSGNFVVNSPGVSVVTITDDDAAPGPNPIDNTSFFVRQQYLDFLGREPDAAGLAFWSGQITACGANASCIAAKRVDVSASFFLSIEFQETGGFALRVQRAAFGRQSNDPFTRYPYLQFMRDARTIGQGVIVGQPGFDTLLEQNKQTYAEQVVLSDDFIVRFPPSPAATYVDALFASAGVTPTAAERTAAINAFGAGSTLGRVAALRSVTDSASVRSAESRVSFVLAEYYGYLRRNPTDAPDFNDVGYQFWLNKLNLFNGNYIDAEMVKAFLTSFEYRGRFGTP